MEERRNYSIKKNRYNNSYLSGFEIAGDNRIVCLKEEYAHYFISGQIDGTKKEANWGRIKFDCEFDEDTIYTVYVFATDVEVFNRKGVITGVDEFLLNDEPVNIKKEFFKNFHKISDLCAHLQILINVYFLLGV